MSPEDNVNTIKRLYEAFGAGDVETILASLVDDVDWVAEAAGDGAPWWGPRTSKEAVAGFFQAIAQTVTVQEFSPLSFTSNDSEVMVLIRWRATYNATGRQVSFNLHHYWRFRNSKIECYRGTEDSAQTLAALAG
jgi:ketosteroid isomerase-like protein